MPQTQINESETNLCGFITQTKARYSSMRLSSPSFHCVAYMNWAPAEMAQRPPSAFRIALQLMLRVGRSEAVSRVQLAEFQSRSPGWVERGGRRITAIQLMVVFNKVTTQLFAHRKTLSRHISPFIPQCTRLFPLWCRRHLAPLHGFHGPALKVLHLVFVLFFLGFWREKQMHIKAGKET